MVTVVRQSIQQHSGHFRVAKNTRPFREAQVGCDDHAGVLVELGQKMKQQCAIALAERQVAQLI